MRSKKIISARPKRRKHKTKTGNHTINKNFIVRLSIIVRFHVQMILFVNENELSWLRAGLLENFNVSFIFFISISVVVLKSYRLLYYYKNYVNQIFGTEHLFKQNLNFILNEPNHSRTTLHLLKFYYWHC